MFVALLIFWGVLFFGFWFVCVFFFFLGGGGGFWCFWFSFFSYRFLNYSAVICSNLLDSFNFCRYVFLLLRAMTHRIMKAAATTSVGHCCLVTSVRLCSYTSKTLQKTHRSPKNAPYFGYFETNLHGLVLQWLCSTYWKTSKQITSKHQMLRFVGWGLGCSATEATPFLAPLWGDKCVLIRCF